MSSFVKKGLLWLIFVAFNFLVIEGALRIFNYFYPTSVFYQESYNQFRGKPLSDNYGFTLNSHGFKDVEYTTQKSRDRYRIIGLGDSFTFGVVPYPYNFLTILEDSLNKLPALPKTEVINMGISSTDPPHYVSMLVEEALPLHPDMILLSLFVGNDIIGSSKQHSRRRSFLGYSYLLSTLYYVYKVTTGLKKNNTAIYGGGMTYCDSCDTFTPEKYLEIESSRSYIFQKDNTVLQNDIEDTMFYLEKIITICKSKNIALVVALLPDEVQVSETIRGKVMDNLKISPSQWDNAQPNRLLSERLTSLNIPVINLLDPFLEHSVTEPVLYIPSDSHWNVKGNELAAREILKELPRYIPKAE